jgi:hypothetical protein
MLFHNVINNVLTTLFMLAIRVIITTISYDALRILSPAIPLLPPVGDFVLLPLIGFGGFIPGLRCSVASFVMLQTG